MTLAQDINIQIHQKAYPHFSGKVSELGISLFKGTWWYIHPYIIVFKIMLLAFASLSFLYIHYSRQKLIKIFQNSSV
ncbi:MAG: hypothetical protein WCO29_14080 [Nostocales cyanobacterium ELA583]|jgi:hypothetical protein